MVTIGRKIFSSSGKNLPIVQICKKNPNLVRIEGAEDPIRRIVENQEVLKNRIFTHPFNRLYRGGGEKHKALRAITDTNRYSMICKLLKRYFKQQLNNICNLCISLFLN